MSKADFLADTKGKTGTGTGGLGRGTDLRRSYWDYGVEVGDKFFPTRVINWRRAGERIGLLR